MRLRDAPYYLGMNKTFFRNSVQPYLTRIPIDKKGIGFSRLELDCWIAYTQTTIGQPPKITPPWETSDLSSPRKMTQTKLNKLPRRARIQKNLLKGKPTAADLDQLVKKTLSADIEH